MLEAYYKLKSKPKTSAELKEALQVIWGNPPRNRSTRLQKIYQIRRLEAGVVAWNWQ